MPKCSSRFALQIEQSSNKSKINEQKINRGIYDGLCTMQKTGSLAQEIFTVLSVTWANPPTRPFLVSVYYQLTITGHFPYNQFYKTCEQDWTDGSALISTRCSFRRPRSDPNPCQVSSEPPPAPGIWQPLLSSLGTCTQMPYTHPDTHMHINKGVFSRWYPPHSLPFF